MEPHPSFNLVSDVAQLLEYRFMVDALLAATAVSLLAGVAGWFMVLRRESFAGHTLSTTAFPGIAAAALLGVPLAAGYFGFCVVAALAIGVGSTVSGSTESARIRANPARPALVGTVQAASLALGFLLLNLYPGLIESPTSLLFGSFLGITRVQVITLAAVAAGTLACFALAGRRLLFASIDESVAAAHGVPARRLGVAFLLLLGMTVAAVAQITGALLTFALLVAPAATAAQLTPRVGRGLVLSVAIALIVAWLGLALSYFTNYAVGFYMTTIAFVLYALARAARFARAVASRRRRRRSPAGVALSTAAPGEVA